MEWVEKLFGTSQIRVLRLFFFNDTKFTLDEVVERARLSKAKIRYELNMLTGLGILEKKARKQKPVWGVSPRFAHARSLRAFLLETTAVQGPEILEALRRAGSLKLVVASGLFTQTPEAKVDLLIVGDRLDERALERGVHILEASLGRELRYASFTTADFKYRMSIYDRLIRDTFDFHHAVLLDKIGLGK